MFHLVYTSHAEDPFSQRALIELLTQSRTYNKKNNITGMLLYLETKFIQILEGKEETVRVVYDKIRNDPRHTRVTTILEGSSPIRVFKNWSMGFKNTSYNQFSEITGFKDIDVFFDQQQISEKAHLLLIFLKLFYKKNIVDLPELID